MKNLHYQHLVLSRYAQIATVCRLFNLGLLPEKDWHELQEWDRSRDLSVGTSHWPRWEEFGVDPLPPLDTPQLFRKKPISQSLRMRVFERDGFKCKKCGCQRSLRADHVVPESKGGKAIIENLQTLCAHCNAVKGSGQ